MAYSYTRSTVNLAEKAAFFAIFGGLTASGRFHSFRASRETRPSWPTMGLGLKGQSLMKVRNSLHSLKKRDKDCRVIRRKGRVYVINKKNPRFKARQG